METELEAVVVNAGFIDFKITWRADVFSGAPQHCKAASFGTLGINYYAYKPITRPKANASTVIPTRPGRK
ncbi:MAG: hypothetical protein L7F77_11720, partial [Candidatus Magnetominusculus sp. LBB02]|nr:hypothetical protein [Candidatus Magnetominusculus sp. LBB02]